MQLFYLINCVIGNHDLRGTVVSYATAMIHAKILTISSFFAYRVYTGRSTVEEIAVILTLVTSQSAQVAYRFALGTSIVRLV